MMIKKNLQLGILLVFTVTISASCSKTFSRGSIQRDCTGTYLELNNKDYLICNPEITNSYSNGSSVKVRYNPKKSCPANSGDICALYHESHGSVEIKEIK